LQPSNPAAQPGDGLPQAAERHYLLPGLGFAFPLPLSVPLGFARREMVSLDAEAFHCPQS
jgi:hypothetical protein